MGKPKILKLDISDFFGSILYSHVKDIAFPKERYAEKIRTLLAMLCYYGDALPQGAPSSPMITNILMRDFDEQVGAWCEARHITYTRYCDDMTFSGAFDSRMVYRFVKETLFGYGFVLNRDKTVVTTSATRQLVTGVVVNQKTNVPAEYKRALRQAVYYCKRFGVAAHMAHVRETSTPRQFLQRLLGKVNFVLQTDTQNVEFAGYRECIKQWLSETDR